jgi:hypothetical protein
MSRSYTSSPSCASIGVLWDCFTFTRERSNAYPSQYPLMLYHVVLNVLLCLLHNEEANVKQIMPV